MKIAFVPRFALPWLAAAGVLIFGIAWRDCVLIASSAMLAMNAFDLQMNAGAPWAGWRAAIRSWSMGVAALAFGLGLWVMVGGVQLAWWTPANDHPVEALVVGSTAAAARWATRFESHGNNFWLLAHLMLSAVAMFALAVQVAGWQAVPCVFAAAAAADVFYGGWCKARNAGALWAADGRW